MKNYKVSYKLYLIANYKNEDVNSFCKKVEQGLMGGATIVQLRAKKSTTKAIIEVGKKIKEITDRYKIPLVVNDRIDIAMLLDCHGVHLGQDDAPIKDSRSLLGSDKIIGVTTRTVKQAQLAQEEGADYVGAGALFVTSTKSDAIPLQLETLKKIKETIQIPVVTIGGINKENIINIPFSLIDGIAVSSGILHQEDVKKATQYINSKVSMHL
ncbi:thiamine phosphate synthase [Proteinivorax tanatarense]|uniref:Thiamine-phosphate synthase n=1 Tax=Proteinivorax tanatarense TaxID=1260629 RepID=A0AAU7VJ35_9FIRM